MLAGKLREPVAGLDRVEFTVDVNLFELADQDDGGIARRRYVAYGYLHVEPLDRLNKTSI